MTAIAAPRFFSSTIGKKVVMAVTGVILWGFTIIHMLGNLQVYLGPAKMDAYGAALKGTPALLWGARSVLLISVVLHMLCAISLARANSRARDFAYSFRSWRTKSYAARTMMISGPILALFIIYHLLHFTVGTVHPSHPNFNPHTVYYNFVSGFQQLPAAIVYVIAMFALGAHLWHGGNSAAQTLGLRVPRYAKLIRVASGAIALAVIIGNLSFPIAVQAGLLK